MKIGDWVLCPQTKDDKGDPKIVAKITSIEGNIVYIQLKNGIVSMPKNYCKVVYVQGINI